MVEAAVHLAAPKPKSAKSRAQLEGEERKRGPAGRTSMYKVLVSSAALHAT